MKTNYTLLLTGLLSLGTVARAQSPVTLKATDYSPLQGIDSTYEPTDNAPFAVLANPAVNGNWNFSQVVYKPIAYINDRQTPPMPNPYAGTKFFGTSVFSFGSGLSYVIKRFYNLTTVLFSSPGETISVRQALPLGSATGSPNDSAIFPAQTISYSNPEIVFQLPVTYPATPWSSVSGSSTFFNLTIGAFGLNNTPGERRTQRSRTNEVTGWGTLVLARPNGAGPSGPIPVLQVRTRILVRDSFFLGGQPAPATLLGAFGLQQGQVDSVTRVELYRMGELTPLVEAMWEGSNTTGTPGGVYIMNQRLPIPAGIGEMPATALLQVSPNPVRRGQSLRFTPYAGSWTATVVNMMGQTVATQKGMGTGASEALELPAALPAGTYFLNLQMGGKVVPAQPFVLLD